MTTPQSAPHDRQQELEHRFEQAVCTGDVSTVQALLEDGSLTSVPNPLRAAAMRLAILKGTVQTVQQLLRCGVSPNEATETDETPAYWAAESENPEILRTLLRAGADPKGRPCKTPIEAAAIRGRLKTLEVLLEEGADPGAGDTAGRNVLHVAAAFDHEPISRQLLQWGVPIDVRDADGLTPLHYAARPGYVRTLQLLLQQGADLHARCNAGMTPALTAALHGRTNTFAQLVAAGADPLARDHQGRSAFDLAWGLSKSRDAAPVWMLQNFPALLPSGEALDTTLVEAVRRGHTGLVKRLVELGADVGQKPGGRTLLQCAPKDATELKRVLRSLRSEAAIASAMSTESSQAMTTPPNPFAL